MKKSMLLKMVAGVLIGTILGGAGVYFVVDKPEEESGKLECKAEVETEEETEDSNEETPETDGYNISDDILPGYRDVLIAYGQASSKVPVEQPENLGNQGYGIYASISMFDDAGVMMSDSKIQYAIKDINGDGYEELLVTYINEWSDSPISESGYDDLQVWTNDGEQVYEVLCSAYRYHVSIREGGVLLDIATGGADDNFYTYQEFNNKGETTYLQHLKGGNLSGVSTYDQVYSEEIEWIPILM